MMKMVVEMREALLAFRSIMKNSRGTTSGQSLMYKSNGCQSKGWVITS
jgi:hypothetical protein